MWATQLLNSWKRAQEIEAPNGKHLSMNQQVVPSNGLFALIRSSMKSLTEIGKLQKALFMSDLP